MTEIFSFFLIIIVILIFFYIAIIKPEIRNIIITALILRLIIIFIGNYISLPDSQYDAKTFENLAAVFAKDGFFEVLKNSNIENKSNFISLVIAVPYSLFGRDILIPITMNLLFSMGTIVLGWHVAKKIWNSSIAKKVAWILAIYPSIILYSSVVLREVYIWFFLLLAINCIINWSKTNDLKMIVFAIINFYILSLFHGPLLLGAVVFLFIVVLEKIKKMYSVTKGKIKLKDVFVLTLIFVFFINLFIGNIDIPKLAGSSIIENINQILIRSENTTTGEASYPIWSKFNDRNDIVFKLPAKLFLFYGFPLPWELQKISHLIFMFDSFFYLFLIFLLLKNFKYIWNNRTLRILFIIFIFYSIIFSLGVGNFGTGFRHRTKFLFLLMLIVAPYLPKITFNRKIKN